MDEFQSIFSEKPGNTSIVEQEVTLTTNDPIRCKMYPLPYATRETINSEIDDMIKLDVIEKSTSAYASPIVLVRKRDGSNRFCIDYRRLNKATVFDPEPMAKANDIYAKLKGKRFFTKLDLSKGYWQIMVKDKDKHKTAFIAPGKGRYQFRRMPFGMVNSAATFNRLMRELFGDMVDIDSYIDDLLIYTDTWEEHLQVLREVFRRIKAAGLTLKATMSDWV